MSKELIRLRDLTMEFDGERILDGINLYINDHEFLTLLARRTYRSLRRYGTPGRFVSCSCPDGGYE